MSRREKTGSKKSADKLPIWLEGSDDSHLMSVAEKNAKNLSDNDGVTLIRKMLFTSEKVKDEFMKAAKNLKVEPSCSIKQNETSSKGRILRPKTKDCQLNNSEFFQTTALCNKKSCLICPHSFFKRMDSNSSVYVDSSENKGRCLRARKKIYKDTVIGTFLGVIRRLQDPFETSSYAVAIELDGLEFVIESIKYGNETRYANSSHDANIVLTQFIRKGMIYLTYKALRTIKKNEELCLDYGESYANFKFRCCCAARNCSGVIGKRPTFLIQEESKEKRRSTRRSRPTDKLKICDWMPTGRAQCSHCKKYFKSRGSLYVHQRRNHKENKN